MKKAKIIVLVFMVVLIVTAIIGFSYSFFINTDEIRDNVATTACFKLTLSDKNSINLDKVYPISDNEGKELIPYEFTIKNVCNSAANYQVNLETLNTSTLENNYLKVMLNDNNPLLLSSYDNINVFVNENIKNSKKLETGIILPNEEISYKLRLWIDENSTVEQSAEKLYEGKITITAVQEKNPDVDIALNLNGGSIDLDNVTKIKGRKLGDIPNPVRLGYEFDGWYSDAEFTNKIFSDTIVTEDINNLYAKWNIITYNIEYNYDDGIATNPITYTIEDEFSINNPTKVGYNFTGWSGDLSGNDISISKGTTGNKVLYANFVLKTFNVTMTVSGGTASISPLVIEYGKSGTVTVTPSSNYYFSSGSCSNGYTIANISTGESATSTQSLTIYNNGMESDSTCTIGLTKKVTSCTVTRHKGCVYCVYTCNGTTGTLTRNYSSGCVEAQIGDGDMGRDICNREFGSTVSCSC